MINKIKDGRQKKLMSLNKDKGNFINQNFITLLKNSFKIELKAGKIGPNLDNINQDAPIEKKNKLYIKK